MDVLQNAGKGQLSNLVDEWSTKFQAWMTSNDPDNLAENPFNQNRFKLHL